MPERKGKSVDVHSARQIVLLLLLSLAVGVLTAAAVACAASLLVVRGTVRLGQLGGAALAALFFAGLTAGTLCRRKMGRKMPLIWSLCGACAVSVMVLICGGILYGMPELSALMTRLFAPLLGGLTAGVLAAVRK